MRLASSVDFPENIGPDLVVVDVVRECLEATRQSGKKHRCATRPHRAGFGPCGVRESGDLYAPDGESACRGFVEIVVPSGRPRENNAGLPPEQSAGAYQR